VSEAIEWLNAWVKNKELFLENISDIVIDQSYSLLWYFIVGSTTSKK
jgi:hypothetical protein